MTYHKRPMPAFPLHYGPRRLRRPAGVSRRQLERRSVLYVNWPQHCGRPVDVDHWRHMPYGAGTEATEPVLSCSSCGKVGYREIFDPDPGLDWLISLSRAVA